MHKTKQAPATRATQKQKNNEQYDDHKSTETQNIQNVVAGKE